MFHWLSSKYRLSLISFFTAYAIQDSLFNVICIQALFGDASLSGSRCQTVLYHIHSGLLSPQATKTLQKIISIICIRLLIAVKNITSVL